MRLVLNEALVCAFVALAAGGNEIGLVDGRTWIRGGVNFVRVMTIPAACRLHVSAQQAELRMKCVVICGEFVLVAGPADGRGLHAERGFRWLQYGVCRVAVGADGSLEVAFGHALPVRTLLVVIVDLGVA